MNCGRFCFWRRQSVVFTTGVPRSIAEPGGCFLWHLFVSLFLCLFVNTITSERLNIGWWNLAVRCIVQKSRPSSNVEVKGQRSRTPGTEKRKTAESSPLTMHGKARRVCCRPYPAHSNRRLHCVFAGGWRDDGSPRNGDLRAVLSAAVLAGVATPVGKSAHTV